MSLCAYAWLYNYLTSEYFLLTLATWYYWKMRLNTRVTAVTVEEIWANMNLKGHKMKSSVRKHNGIKHEHNRSIIWAQQNSIIEQHHVAIN